MPSLASIPNHPASPELFHAAVEKRLAPTAETIRVRAEVINRQFPELKAETVRKADQALQGMLVLPGTGAKPYFVGNPPRWFDDPFQDTEYLCLLNRMDYWIPLLRAFSLTGDPRYAQKVTDELRNWLDSCPRISLDSPQEFHRPAPWRALEAGIRLFLSWPLVIPHLLGTPFLTPDLLARYAVSVFEHGEVLEQICPQLWPHADHNHYLMENLGLLCIATLFPEFSIAKRWQTHAMREIERCAAAQITPDGGQIEGCPHYHNGCIGWFVQSLTVARAHDLDFSAEFISRMNAAIHYSLHSLRPSGTAVPWGDSDADMIPPIRSILSGFRLFQNQDYLRIAIHCCGGNAVKNCAIETVWDDPDINGLLRAIDKAASASSPVSFPLDLWEKTLSEATLRTDWSHDALSVFFACRTPVNNTHAHMDPTGFDFTAYGRPLVIDPGRFCYREDADRYAFKSAAYHNVLVINGRDPFAYISSWYYGPQKEGRILDVKLDPRCKFALARHDNYEPVIHYRAVAIIDEELLLVMDRLENLRPDDRLQLYFHFDSTRVELDPKMGRAQTKDEGLANVVLVPSRGLKSELLPGRVSDFQDISRPSTRLCLAAPSSEETTRILATVIVPWRASSIQPAVSEPRIRSENGHVRCEFEVNGVSRSFKWPEARF